MRWTAPVPASRADLVQRPVAMGSYLEAIVAAKRAEVAGKLARVSLKAIQRSAQEAPKPRHFAAALQSSIHQHGHAVIAEFKRASPSKGSFGDVPSPSAIARAFEAGGAACMSVLTDTPGFKALPSDLAEARAACSLPVLRKDFMIDAYQVYESRAMGADCVLLIAACLSDTQLADYSALASALGMCVILEVHDESELDRAAKADAPCVGINSRNLHSFDVSLNGVAALAQRAGQNRLLIAESGIRDARDVSMLRRSGLHAFLVGEAAMRAADPARFVAGLVKPVSIRSKTPSADRSNRESA